jgi:cytochrome c oxidase subunit 2
MCGSSHYAMRGIIHVVSQMEFDLWMAKQKPNYVRMNEAKQQPQPPAPAKDTVSKTTAVNVTIKSNNN